MMMISQQIQFNAWSPSPPPPPPPPSPPLYYTYSSSPYDIHQTPLHHSQLLPLVPAQIRYKNPSNTMSILLKATSSSSPSSLSSSETVFDVLGDISIFNATGESLNFKHLWDPKEGIAVVVLLRHFGCPCSWEFANALKEIKPRLDAAGVKLIAIGVGTPNKARLLAERLPFPLECLYADPHRKAYDILGLYYGFGRTFFNPASVKVFSRFGALRKATKNYTIEATPDDRSGVLQQGGMFVFKGNQLLYARKDEGTGDHAPLDDILDICSKVPVA